jgi:hypothetical protein
MRRLREKRKAEAADKPPVVIRYRRPKDRRSRPDQWADAIDTLTDCLDRYQEWRDNLPASLADSALAERLDAMLECATSLTSYRLPICRADLDGTDVPPKMPRCRSIPPAA